jgi:hypothetical protein
MVWDVCSVPDNRDASGKFKPGQSGNPGGRPRGDLARLIRERVTEDGQASPDVLVDFWFSVLANKVPGMEGEAKIQDMQRASEVLAERGWGKATQPMEHSGPEGKGVSIAIDLGGK